MGSKLYVGNLAPTTTGEELQKVFGAFGTVKWADIAVDAESGQSKGFAFVQMSNDEEARRAVYGLRGRQHQGKRLAVSEARTKKTEVKRRPGPGRPPGARPRGVGGPTRDRYRPR
jgi:cold-inducible RNA-binding protein